MINLTIPTILAKYAKNQTTIKLDLENLNQLGLFLKNNYPELHRIIFTKQGSLNGFVNLYLQEEMLTHKINQDLSIAQNATLHLVTSVSGG